MPPSLQGETLIGPAGPGAQRQDDGTRRTRDLPSAADELRECMAAKVLHGWLQNRHQTLMPLQVNLARLDRQSCCQIVRLAALAARAGNDPGSVGHVRAWLASVGANGAALDAYDRACEHAPPLPDLMAELAGSSVASLGFVVALVAARTGGASGILFAEYVAARFALPTAAVRSAERRYRV